MYDVSNGSQAALVVVHIQDSAHRYWLAYRHGEVSDGIQRLKFAINAAAGHGIPTIFLGLGEGSYRNFPTDLAEDLLSYDFLESANDGFINNPDRPETLKGILDGYCATDLVLAGAHRGACVLLTARSAVKNGFKIHTSDQLLFGYTGDFDPERKAQKVLEEYRTLGTVYESVEDIVEKLFNAMVASKKA